MSLLYVLLILVIVGVCLWAFNTFGAEYVDPKFVKLINAAAIIGAVIWLLFILIGYVGSGPAIQPIR